MLMGVEQTGVIGSAASGYFILRLTHGKPRLMPCAVIADNRQGVKKYLLQQE